MSLTKWFKSVTDKLLAARPVRTVRRPRRYVCPLPSVTGGLTPCEERIMPSTGYWHPLSDTQNDTWQYVAPGGATNWTSDSNGYQRIFDNDTDFGYPGEYGTNGASSDVAVFTSGSGVNCTSAIVPNTLEALTVGSNPYGNYTGKITLGGDLTVTGSAGPGHFFMQSGTIDVNGNHLSIKDCFGGVSYWNGGTITDSSVADNGSFNVVATASTESTTILEIENSSHLLETNMNISGAAGQNVANEAYVWLQDMTDNLNLYYQNTITVNSYGGLYLANGNTDANTDTQGGIVSGFATTNYGIVCNGGFLDRGNGQDTTGNKGGVLLDRPVEVLGSGGFTINTGDRLDIAGSDSSGNAVYQNGSGAASAINAYTDSTTQANWVGTLCTTTFAKSKTAGTTFGNVTISQGKLTIWSCDPSQPNPAFPQLVMGSMAGVVCTPGTLTIGTATLDIPFNLGVNNTPTGTGFAQVVGNVDFLDGSVYQPHCETENGALTWNTSLTIVDGPKNAASYSVTIGAEGTTCDLIFDSSLGAFPSGSNRYVIDNDTSGGESGTFASNEATFEGALVQTFTGSWSQGLSGPRYTLTA
jgi:hypothetical protein